MSIVAVTGISRAHISARSRRSASDTGGTRLFVYGYDEDGKFQRKSISKLEVPFYARRKVHSLTVTCSVCTARYQVLYKTKDELENLLCKVCGK